MAPLERKPILILGRPNIKMSTSKQIIKIGEKGEGKKEGPAAERWHILRRCSPLSAYTAARRWRPSKLWRPSLGVRRRPLREGEGSSAGSSCDGLGNRSRRRFRRRWGRWRCAAGDPAVRGQLTIFGKFVRVDFFLISRCRTRSCEIRILGGRDRGRFVRSFLLPFPRFGWILCASFTVISKSARPFTNSNLHLRNQERSEGGFQCIMIVEWIGRWRSILHQFHVKINLLERRRAVPRVREVWGEKERRSRAKWP